MIITRITYLLRTKPKPYFWMDWEEKQTSQKRIDELERVHPDIRDWVILYMTYKLNNGSIPELRGIISLYDRSIDGENEENLLEELDRIHWGCEGSGFVTITTKKGGADIISHQPVVSFENDGNLDSGYIKELIKWKVGLDHIFSI